MALKNWVMGDIQAFVHTPNTCHLRSVVDCDATFGVLNRDATRDASCVTQA